MSNPVLCLHLIIYQFFNEVKLKCLSYLLSAENTCTFNNNKLFKKFKEKLALTPWAITCIPALVHEKMEIVTLHTRMWLILPPTEGIRNWEVGRGSKRRQFPRGWGQILKVFLSRDFETKVVVFIDDLTLTVIANCFFHSLPVWFSPHVSNMNVIRSWKMPVIQLIALYFTI